MIEVNKFTSEKFTSNVYTITSSLKKEEVVLIDCGEFNDIVEFLPSSSYVKSILITHYHYDHIYYIQKFIDRFPNVIFYGSQKTLKGLFNSKRNLSFYYNDPIEIKRINYEILGDGQQVPIFRDTILQAIETEGHCEGSLTYLIDNFVFTGDALIPNIPTVTKLKTGDKLKAKVSIEKIRQISNSQSIICPGHLGFSEYINVDWSLYLND